MGSTAIRRALITGASGGLGTAFARQLAARGVDLVLSARDDRRLAGLADQITGGYAVGADTLAADLVDPGTRAIVEQRIATHVDPVDLLVNCAGFGARGRFHELPLDRQDDLVRLHTEAVVALTQAALRRMVDAGRGGVITVSSTAGFAPAPLSAAYGAAKSFQTWFTLAAHEEVRGTGVRVLALCPGYVPTGFDRAAGIDRRVPGWLTGDADGAAAAALRAFTRGRSLCVPGRVDAVLATAARTAPMSVGRRVSAAVRRRW